jgi:AraC-like DNA-binding protein
MPMSHSPEALTETPDRRAARLLQDVLGVIHLTGSLILRAEFTAPWAYESPEERELRELLQPGTSRVILFHVIPEGSMWIELAKGARLDLAAGDVVVIPYADQHRAGSPGGGPPVPIDTLMPPMPWSELPVLRHGGGGETTKMVCGYLLCEDLLFNPFLRALPSLFRVRPPDGPTADWLRASVAYALEGAPPAAAQRLFELIFIEVMRLHAETLSPEQAGWLAALADPLVGRALSFLHAAPAAGWTVDELARRVGTSRSVLDDRFRRRLGRPPMRYLTEWRLQLAADLLRTTELGVAEIAERVGYESETSLSRAFRRHVGEPPARWREQRRAGAR